MSFLVLDAGIIFGKYVYPICIATESNDDPKRWENKIVDVLGYATKDGTESRAANLKAAELEVFSQATCNNKLRKRLKKVEECKYPFIPNPF